MKVSDLDYFRGSFKLIKEGIDKDGKKALVFKARYSGKMVDYSNTDNLMTLSFNARKNANDIFALVMKEYKESAPADLPNFEMLVAMINLSSELYMKCIIYYYQLNQGKQCKGLHNLEDYFLRLPDDIKSSLKTIDDDFEAKLKTISNYFNQFRYSFEFNWISSERFAFSFAERLNEICNSIKIQRPTEVVYSDKRLLIKHGEKIVWDSARSKEYKFPIISKDD